MDKIEFVKKIGKVLHLVNRDIVKCEFLSGKQVSDLLENASYIVTTYVDDGECIENSHKRMYIEKITGDGFDRITEKLSHAYRFAHK